MANLIQRVKRAIQWRLNLLRRKYHRFLGWMGPRWYVNVRWPFRKPYQRDSLRLSASGGGIGDALMCAPIFREIKRRNPRCRITFLTRHGHLFQGNPNVDAIELYTAENAPTAIRLSYAHLSPPPKHGFKERTMLSMMGECVGLVMTDNQLDCAQGPVTETLRQQVAAIPHPRIAIQISASDWTPNKDWPVPYWQEVITALLDEFDIIEIGTRSNLTGFENHPRFHSFVGATDVAGFTYLISQSDLFMGPVSGGMHVARAFHVPSVIVFGGYESPSGYQYEDSTTFYSPVSCAPCWLTTACPSDHKCLTMIKPPEVIAAVQAKLRQSTATP